MRLPIVTLLAAALFLVNARSSAAAPSAQSPVASKTASFATVEKSDAAYKDALEAHDLEKAKALNGKAGAFHGKVALVYGATNGNRVVLDFDANYKTALTAPLFKDHFPDFPDLNALEGKEVLITGEIVLFQGAPQIVLTKPEQVRLVK